MRIVDVDAATKPLFCQCLEDWNPEVLEAGDRRRRWFDRLAPRGLRGKLALDDAGTPGGMIQYLPIEESTVDGEGLCFVRASSGAPRSRSTRPPGASTSPAS